MRTAVIPAAGLATRMLPASKAVPKVMLPIVDKPVIQYNVEQAVAAGIRRIVVITSLPGSPIEDHFRPHPELESRLAAAGRSEELAALRSLSDLASFVFVQQQEPKGNGHAVLCARGPVGDDEPFAMIFGDDLVDAETPCLQQMIDVYDRYGGSVAAVMQVPREDVPRYGIVAGEPLGGGIYHVRSVVEKPSVEQAPSNLAAVYAWILTPPIFQVLADTPPGTGGEIWLVDAVQKLIEAGNVYAVEFKGNRYDAGQKLGFLQATFDLALKRPDIGPELREYLKARLGLTP